MKIIPIKTHTKILTINGAKINFTYKFSKRKSTEIRIKRDGSVLISAPLRASQQRVDEFVSKKQVWIFDAVNKMQNNIAITGIKKFEDAEAFYFLGKKYQLKIQQNLRNYVEILDDVLTINATFISKKPLLKKIYSDWLTKQIEQIFEQRLMAILPYANDLGIRFEGKIIARKMKSRYGTCSHDNRIFLNADLIFIDAKYIDYVIAHELCHIIHKNHSPRYYGLLSQLMPDWKPRRKELNGFVFG
jgi:predicted metal-dependent hydrolase